MIYLEVLPDNFAMKPKDITLVRSSYQPSKSELEKEVDVLKEDGTLPTPEELAQAVLQDVNIKWKDRP